jgi:hypothetical protein
MNNLEFLGSQCISNYAGKYQLGSHGLMPATFVPVDFS